MPPISQTSGKTVIKATKPYSVPCESDPTRLSQQAASIVLGTPLRLADEADRTHRSWGEELDDILFVVEARQLHLGESVNEHANI